MAEDLDRWASENGSRFVDELIDFLRIPSISADPAHAGDVRRSAEHLAQGARDVGFSGIEIIETDGHPAVYGELISGEDRPTVLIYGHHDVQPVDPLDEWESPPFEPVVRDGKLRARGAVDDKGQVWMHLKAIEAWTALHGTPPVNVRLIVEGEEEIGSPHFEELVVREKARLAADIAVVSDTSMHAEGVPSLCTGLRGLAMVEISVEGPTLDLHSGQFGGGVANPCVVLAEMLAQLHDDQGRVTVPGFYDDVDIPTDAQRAAFTDVPYDESAFLREAGSAPAVHGEAGWSVWERLWVRPTLEINGIWGGYSGPGSKTIIPARASAKLSCRLVPHQDPEKIANLVADHLRAIAPPTVRVQVDAHGGGRPVVTPTDHPAVQAAARAMHEVFGVAPVFTRGGGSIPPVEVFQRVLGIPTVLLGVGLPDDQIHAPNEKFDLAQFHAGVRVLSRLWGEL